MDLNKDIQKIRDYMNLVFSYFPNTNSRVLDASKYMALNESGGLYRPLLLLATARDYSANDENALPISAAVEFVHVATLIADDIMDNSNLRRGKPSCHVVFEKDIAHLTHMNLREIAEIMMVDKNNLSDKQKVEITGRASKAGMDMIYGQEKDVSQTRLDNAEDVIKMYEQKSGALIGVALASGGIIGNASELDINLLEKIGVSMGVSYQICDDYLDFFAPASETGKPERQDEKKKTLLSLIGISDIKRLRDSKDREVESYIDSLSVESKNLKEVIGALREKNDALFGKIG